MCIKTLLPKWDFLLKSVSLWAKAFVMDFYGEFAVSLDVKGRFLMPGDIKKSHLASKPDDAESWILKRGIEKCLELMPQAHWQKKIDKIKTKDEFDPAFRIFKRTYVGNAKRIDFDSIGRLLIPKELIDYAQLKKNIVLVSTITEIEIWDSETYHKQFVENYSSDEFSALAKKVMGT